MLCYTLCYIYSLYEDIINNKAHQKANIDKYYIPFHSQSNGLLVSKYLDYQDCESMTFTISIHHCLSFIMSQIILYKYMLGLWAIETGISD